MHDTNDTLHNTSEESSSEQFKENTDIEEQLLQWVIKVAIKLW